VKSNYSTITEKRIELKDVFSTSEFSKFEKAIKLSKFSYYCPFPTRQINSIYFDDYSYSSLEDSIEGNSLRTKKRIRWYGMQKKKIDATLEIKKKQGIYSWKELYKNKYTVNPNAKSWGEMVENKDKEDSYNTALLNQIPKSILSYNRQYFCSFDSKVRITIDQNLQSFPQNFPFSPNLIRSKKHYNFMIIEVKVASNDEHLIEQVRHEIPFTPRRFSKYCESLIPQKDIYLF
jgi:SPX domain protein involved in polyphosphate accumulation